MEVLLHFYDEQSGSSLRSLVRIPARQGDTVGDLKKHLRTLEGFPAGAELSVQYNGQRLGDRDTLDSCGVAASDGTEQWACNYVYPAGWTFLGHKKAYPKVASGHTWVPLRDAALQQGAVGGAWVLLLLICVCNTLLAAWPT